MTLRRLALASLMLLAAGSAHATTYYAVQTGMSGGQTGIDQVSTSTWSFTAGASWAFGGGSFEMKSGSATVDDITLSIYEGTNYTGTLVASRTLTHAEFCAQIGACQSFDTVNFLFIDTNTLLPAPVTLNSGTTYFVDLTSPTGTGGNDQYFIKGNTSTLSFFDGTTNTGNPIPSGYVTTVSTNTTTTPTNEPPPPAPPPTEAPEPVSMALLGVGLAGLGVMRRRRQATAEA